LIRWISLANQTRGADLKSAKAEVDKRLETSKSQAAGLEKDLEAARQSIKERERELAILIAKQM
jgi:hypothetical protein